MRSMVEFLNDFYEENFTKRACKHQNSQTSRKSSRDRVSIFLREMLPQESSGAKIRFHCEKSVGRKETS